MRKRCATAALLAGLATPHAARAAEVESLREAGPPDERFNIVVLGDGYRAQDQAQLSSDAKAIVDYLFDVVPLKQYAQFFNVKLVHVVSNQNGADNGTYGADRDTALGANFGCYGVERLLCINEGVVAKTAADNVKEVNFTIVLVNDPKYGGAGGTICTASTDVQSFEILAHEVGHSLAGLADEYVSASTDAPCDATRDCEEPNVTLRNLREQIKWKDWIDDATPIPTPAADQYGGVIGLFEGARYLASGVYRPQLTCKMRDLGAEYCAVCAEQFVRSIWTADNIHMIESASPAEAAVQSDTCDPIHLSITNPPIVPSSYRYVWSVDGNVQLETTNELTVMPGALMQGQHQVNVTVADATQLVRSDPDSVLHDQRAWSITLSRNDCPVPVAGAGGSASGASMKARAPSPPPPAPTGCGCALPGAGAPRRVWSLVAWSLAALVRRRRTLR